LLAPPVLVLAVALWSAIAGFGSLVQLFRLAVSLDFARAATQFPSLDAAGRVLLASLGYFAMLFALRPLAGGLFGRGWARLRLVPGLLLAIPCAWLFIAGAELADGVPPLASVPAELWRVLVILLLLHGIAVAVVSAQDPATSPVARVTSGPRLSERPARRPEVEEPEMPDHDTDHWPIVRFGPPADDPTPAPDMSDTQALRVAGLLHLLSSEPDPASDRRDAANHADAHADSQAGATPHE
jgi:hypothetical protein